jgi:hypothetical protein
MYEGGGWVDRYSNPVSWIARVETGRIEPTSLRNARVHGTSSTLGNGHSRPGGDGAEGIAAASSDPGSEHD